MTKENEIEKQEYNLYMGIQLREYLLSEGLFNNPIASLTDAQGLLQPSDDSLLLDHQIDLLFKSLSVDRVRGA